MLEYFAYKKYKKTQVQEEEVKKSTDKAKHRRSKSLTDRENRNANRTIIDNHREVAPEVTGGGGGKGKCKERASSSSTKSSANGRPAIAPTPILTDQDERFFEGLTSSPVSPVDADGGRLSRLAMPGQIRTPDISWDDDSISSVVPSGPTGPTPEKPAEPPEAATSKSNGAKGVARRLTTMIKNEKDKRFGGKKSSRTTSLVPDNVEVACETDDLTRVLDDLNMSAKNNKAFSLSRDNSELVAKFALVLKDVVNGVPTAIDDLRALLDDTDGTLARNYEKLPKSMKKLVQQMPDKLSKSLAPELMAVAAEAQGLSKESAAASQGGLKSMAKSFLMPKNMADLVTKPGAIVGLLKGIMNALKVRWPAFIGTNVIWSVAIFLLLLVLWYCHKRGREVRLEKERAAEACEAGDRIEELPDDLILPQTSS